MTDRRQCQHSLQEDRKCHDLLVSVCSQQLGPQVQTVDSLPAVHFPEGVLGAHGQSAPQQHCQLADGREGLLVGSCHVQSKHLHHTAAHEMDVRHACRVHKLSVLYKAAVHSLHPTACLLASMLTVT